MPWLKLNAGSIVFDINMKDCNATELIQLKIKGAGININQKNREVPKEEMIYLACALKKCLSQTNYHWQHGDSVNGHYGIWSSPKCWCKLNSANLSFHKLKHTGFF